MTPEHAGKHTVRFKDKKIVFAQGAHEPVLHVYSKVLVYALYHKDYRTLRVEAKVDGRFQPDLSAQDYDGTMLFWAECGNVSLNKVEKLFKKYPRAHFVFVKEGGRATLFEDQLARQTKDMVRTPVVDIVIYPEHFHEWNVSPEGDVYIRKDDVTINRWERRKLKRKGQVNVNKGDLRCPRLS